MTGSDGGGGKLIRVGVVMMFVDGELEGVREREREREKTKKKKSNWVRVSKLSRVTNTDKVKGVTEAKMSK